MPGEGRTVGEAAHHSAPPCFLPLTSHVWLLPSCPLFSSLLLFY